MGASIAVREPGRAEGGPIDADEPRSWLVLASRCWPAMIVSLAAVIGVITLVQGRFAAAGAGRTVAAER